MDDDMDAYEQMSWDLEAAQQKRYAKVKGSDEFWDAKEVSIFEIIKDYREVSMTFDPDNSR